MPFCHGQGGADQANNGDGGCCYVNGAVCPLRMKQVGGHIFNAAGTDLGTTTQYINSLTNNGAARNRAQQQAQGVIFFCLAAIKVIMVNPNLLNDRPAFEAAWNSQADYVAQVRPAWAALEQQAGFPAGSYQCSSWKGANGLQCCFSETTTVNEAKASPLNATAVTVRRAGGL